MKVSELRAEIRAEVQSELEPLRKEIQRLNNLVESSLKEWKTFTKTKANTNHKHSEYLSKADWDLAGRFKTINDNIQTIAEHVGLRVTPKR